MGNQMMKTLASGMFFVLITTATASATTYYFANSGNDASNACANISTPCQTITKLNSLSYTAGDVIALKGGDTFTGIMPVLVGPNFTTAQNVFNTLGNNPPPAPVTITSYGTGHANLVSTNPTSIGAALDIINLDNIIVANLNISTTAGSFGNLNNTLGGVLIYNGESVQHYNITVQNVSSTGFWNGIEVRGKNRGFGFTNLSILDNHVYGSVGGETQGIYVQASGGAPQVPAHFNVSILGNLVEGIGGNSKQYTGGNGNGILMTEVNGGLSAFNVVRNGGALSTGCGGPAGNWTYDSTNIIHRFNEAYNISPTTFTKGCDWDDFDDDGYVTNSIIEYNYGHNSWGSCVLNYAVGTWGPNIARYNVCENNAITAAASYFGNCFSLAGGTFVGRSASFYNNSCYLNSAITSGFINNHNIAIEENTDGGTTFSKNILQSTGSHSGLVSDPFSGGAILNNNDYYNETPVTDMFHGDFSGCPGNKNYATYALWKAACPAGDPNSLNVNPVNWPLPIQSMFAVNLSLKDWLIIQRALMELREHEPAANKVFKRLRLQLDKS
jgi:hypothetical protein